MTLKLQRSNRGLYFNAHTAWDACGHSSFKQRNGVCSAVTLTQKESQRTEDLQKDQLSAKYN